MATWRRSTHAAGPSVEWQPISRKRALGAIRIFGGVRIPPPGRETSVGEDQNYRYFIVNRSGKLELQRRERLGMTLRNPGGHQLRFDEYPLRDDKRKKSPPKYSFYQLTLEDVLSPDFGREQLYTLDQQGFMARVRRNGQVKTWKRDPNRVEIPLKFGMYEAFRITDPSELYVMATDFPINVDPTPAETADVVRRLTGNPGVRELSAYNSYEALNRFLGDRDERKIANNTTVVRLDDIDSEGTRWAIAVILHHTKIITFYEGGGAMLDSGGYQTVTTKQRMRQFLPPGWSMDRDWSLHGRDPDNQPLDLPFYDGINIPTREGFPPRRENPRPRRTRRRMGLIKDMRFFREHGGGIVGEAARGALSLTRAEREAERRGWHVEWVPDDDADWSWLDQPGFEREKARDHEVYGAVLKDRNGNVLASLWGIFDPDSKYQRVVEAELASEALSER